MARKLRTKVIAVPLQKGVFQNEDGTITKSGYFTSDNTDEIGDIITRSATEAAIPAYREWGNIRYMHQPKPVGKVLRIGEADGLAWNEVEIKVIDPQAIFEVENELLTALSVGILIDWADITVMEGGGWEIGNYKLAEISLVDHPANYDARLKSPADEDLRMLARQYGFDSVAQSMYQLLEDQKEAATMDDEITVQDEDVETEATPVEEPEVDEKALEETVDEPVTEDNPDSEKELEAEVTDTPEVETEVEVDEVETEEEVEEEDKDLDDGEVEDAEIANMTDREMLELLLDGMESLQREIAAVKGSLEAMAKVLESKGQAVSEETDTPDAEPEEEVDEDAELGVPVNRQGATQETEEVTELPEDIGKSPVGNLRRALEERFTIN